MLPILFNLAAEEVSFQEARNLNLGIKVVKTDYVLAFADDVRFTSKD